MEKVTVATLDRSFPRQQVNGSLDPPVDVVPQDGAAALHRWLLPGHHHIVFVGVMAAHIERSHRHPLHLNICIWYDNTNKESLKICLCQINNRNILSFSWGITSDKNISRVAVKSGLGVYTECVHALVFLVQVDQRENGPFSRPVGLNPLGGLQGNG